MLEKTTIVVTARDRFSTAAHCLNNILKHTPQPYELAAVLGGTPPAVEKELVRRFGDRVRFVFKPEFLNLAQARNAALREIVRTRLAIFVDTDVFVRPGWYEPLVERQLATGAAVVGPLILDRQNIVHAGGGDLFITHSGGTAYATMEIRYALQAVGQDTNIPSRENDFLEVHCQLVVADEARRLGIYDEALREFNELDAGLTIRRAGGRLVNEPRSVVYLYYKDRLTEPEDIAYFCWKWDMGSVREGIAYFKQKWGYDLNYRGLIEKVFASVNLRCNFFARRWPSKLAIRLDWLKYRALHALVDRFH